MCVAIPCPAGGVGVVVLGQVSCRSAWDGGEDLRSSTTSGGSAGTPDDLTLARTVVAIRRVPRGNFRLLEGLAPQIHRVLTIDDSDTVTHDFVEAARSTLVVGLT